MLYNKLNKLFNLMPGCKDNPIFAAEIELPFAFRIHEGSGDNTRTIKSEFIIKAGSHHKIGLNALFAYRLYQDISFGGNTIEIIKDLQESNLAILYDNPNNIAAIANCMPKNSDARRLIEFAFPEAENGSYAKSDFYYYAKNSSRSLSGKPGPGLQLIGEIYAILQRHNRIESSEELAKKLIAVAEAANI